MSSNESKTLNLNTVFLAVLLALSGWTLNRVSNLGEQMSAIVERNTGYTRDLTEIRARLALCEAQIQTIRLDMAKAEK